MYVCKYLTVTETLNTNKNRLKNMDSHVVRYSVLSWGIEKNVLVTELRTLLCPRPILQMVSSIWRCPHTGKGMWKMSVNLCEDMGMSIWYLALLFLGFWVYSLPMGIYQEMPTPREGDTERVYQNLCEYMRIFILRLLLSFLGFIAVICYLIVIDVIKKIMQNLDNILKTSQAIHAFGLPDIKNNIKNNGSL